MKRKQIYEMYLQRIFEVGETFTAKQAHEAIMDYKPPSKGKRPHFNATLGSNRSMVMVLRQAKSIQYDGKGLWRRIE